MIQAAQAAELWHAALEAALRARAVAVESAELALVSAVAAVEPLGVLPGATLTVAPLAAVLLDAVELETTALAFVVEAAESQAEPPGAQ